MVGNAHPTRILMKSNNNEFQIQEQISGGKKMDRENKSRSGTSEQARETGFSPLSYLGVPL